MNLKVNSKNYRVKFPVTDCERSFGQFAIDMDGDVIDDNVLQLSGRVAKGLVKKSQTQPGCCMRAWNLLFHQPVELYKPGIDSDNKSISIIYIITPESCQLKSIGNHQQFNQTGIRSTLLVGNNIDLKFEILAGLPVQIIDISATTFWLALQFRKAGVPLENVLERIHDNENPLILNKICKTANIMSANKLFDAIVNADNAKDHDKARTMSTNMVLDFLNKTLNSQVPTVQDNNDAHFTKVMEAEIIMQVHLQKNLPTVSDIAQQVQLSESTLKRHFKVIFGKSMYEYYLEKKMNLAKLLLLEQPLTVNQAANLLGYEKVSNFIEIFKKHHGFSPGSMKKKGFSNM